MRGLHGETANAPFRHAYPLLCSKGTISGLYSLPIIGAAAYTMATVDIIMPAYNAAAFLPMALDSVVAQTFADWRILLIDDGSTDHTAALAAQYAEQLGPRLRYIHQENRGLPAARNTAILHAEAEFLALLDADDVWLPHRLEASLRSFSGKAEVGLSYGFIEGIDLAGDVVRHFPMRPPYPEGRVASLIYMRSMDLPCPTVTFRRACVQQTGGFDETLRATEDRDLWVRIAQRYAVACVPEVIAQYRTSPQAMTTDPERMLTSQLRFIAKHFGSPGCGVWERRVALASIYRQRAEAMVKRGNHPLALGSALRALWFGPLQLQNLRTATGVVRRWLHAATRQSSLPQPGA